MEGKVCCFIGHRKIEKNSVLKKRIVLYLDKLISQEGIDTFLFGSKSDFNNFCYEIVTEMKIKYPHIKRVYVRAEYPYINSDYERYLLEKYECSYYPEKILNSGKLCYVERNFEMIDNSRFCVFYYDDRISERRKSGTRIAWRYSVKKQKEIYNVFEL